jgi:hypothetical protein
LDGKSRGPGWPHLPDLEDRSSGRHDWVVSGEVPQRLFVIGLDNREAVRVVVGEDRSEHTMSPS